MVKEELKILSRGRLDYKAVQFGSINVLQN